jgi:hypothetical protein
MAPTAAIQTAPGDASPADSAGRYTGEVVYIYAFDVAYEMKRLPVRELLGQPVAQFVVDASKRSPRQLFFYRPEMVRLPPMERIGPRGPVRMHRTIKLLPVGAVSITIRVPFEVARLEDLVVYHDLRFGDGSRLHEEVRRLAEDVRQELHHYSIGPVPSLADEEAYTVFCINSHQISPPDEPVSVEQWMLQNRRSIAALLTEEPRPAQLSEQEVVETTSKYFSYYESDVVVVDWDAALIVDEPRYFDELLHIMELANLQLAELEAYDRILDGAVEQSYRDIIRRRVRGWKDARGQRRLREIRVDLARLSDELLNITKFFGDWHLARIYQGLSQRFHLSDWHRTIDQKLKMMDDLYQLLRTEQTNRWMLMLEAMIVLLFVIDVIMLLLGSKG